MGDQEQVTLSAPEDPALAALLPDRVADLSGSGPGSGLVVVRGDLGTSEVTWYDTADARLARWGASVQHQQGQGWTVLVPGADGQLREHRVRGKDAAPPAAVTNLVTAFARHADLHPAGRAQVTVRTAELRGPEGGDVAATVLDRQVHTAGHPRGPVRVLEVTGGPDAPPGLFAWLLRHLSDAGLQPRDPATQAQLVRPPTSDLPTAVTVPEVGPDARVEELLRHLLATWTLELIRHDPDIRLGHDDEPVHQARVAGRRLRWMLRAFAAFVDSTWAERLRAHLKWLDEHQAAVRDLDVARMRLIEQAATLPDRDDAAAARRLAGAYSTQRTSAHVALLAAMEDSRYVTLLDELSGAVLSPVLTERAQEPAADAAREVVGSVWRRLRKAARRVGARADDDELHLVRRRARQARYTAEAVTPVTGKPAARFARAARRLQEELGEQHDAVVSQERLRTLAVARGRRLREALAAGQLLATERQAAERHAAAWPARWKDLNRNKLRAWFDRP